MKDFGLRLAATAGHCVDFAPLRIGVRDRSGVTARLKIWRSHMPVWVGRQRRYDTLASAPVRQIVRAT